MKTMELMGTIFEVQKDVRMSLTELESLKSNVWRRYKDLYSYYGRPSDTKKAIYKDWENYFLSLAFRKADTIVLGNGVTGGNSMTFSYGALIYNTVDDAYYIINITKCHNRITKIVVE